MKTIRTNQSWELLLATGALAIGLVTTAHAIIPRTSLIEADPPTTSGSGDDASPKVEQRVIVTTVDADDQAPGAKQERHVIVRTQGGGGGSSGGGGAGSFSVSESGVNPTRIIVRTVEDDGNSEPAVGKEGAWLGLSTEEPSDALTSQLALQPGEGLLVTYVATNSPAAKAGLQKNDVLVEMDGQKLVLPGQLRKLVQMRKEGDKVDLTYYRGGKKQTASATLTKAKAGFGLFGEGGGLDGLKQLQSQIKDGLDGHLKELRESLARAGVNQENIQVEVRRGVDQARKAIAEAMAQVREAKRGAPPAPPALEGLSRGGVEVDKDATVTIKSRDHSVRTIVKTDDSGTCVIVANPKKHLTAHDKDGKLVFDGEIETGEQQDKVPREVWKKVQPMIEQLNQAPEPPPAPEAPEPKKTSARSMKEPWSQG